MAGRRFFAPRVNSAYPWRGVDVRTLQRTIGNRAVTRLLQSDDLRRKVAFEAESHQDYWRASGKRDGDEPYKAITDTKNALGSVHNLDVTSDSGRMEFVTRPLANEAEINEVFGSMRKLINIMNDSSGEVQAGTSDDSGFAWRTVSGYTWYRFKPGTVGKRSGAYDSAKFAPQATLDIPFDKVASFLKVLEGQQGRDSLRLVGSHFEETAAYLRAKRPEEFIPVNDLRELGQDLHVATRGFLAFVLMALYDAYTFNPTTREDPKYAFPVMPRNRYSEMYTAADGSSGGQLARVWPSFVAGINGFRKEIGSERMFTGAYKTDDASDPGFTVSEWLTSITTPLFMKGEFAQGEGKARQSDLLSPPPGQRSKKEGLGAYDLAGGTVPFFELRDFMSAHSEGKHYALPCIHTAAISLLKLEDTMAKQKVT